MKRFVAVALGGALICAAHWTCVFAATNASDISPQKGLMITYTSRSTMVVSGSGGMHGYNDLDQESWLKVLEPTPEKIHYKLRFSAPGNEKANADAGKFSIERFVLRKDIEQSTRMTLLESTTDPHVYAGQTFAGTSTKALQLLNSGAEVPFVLGINTSSGFFGAMSSAAASATATASSDSLAGNIGSALSMLGSGREYFRGNLRRVEAGPVQFPVLLDGVRTMVPAVHAAGTVTGTSSPATHIEFWWLNNPSYPLTLKWVMGNVFSQVTRIDRPAENGGEGGSGSAANGDKGQAAMSESLSKSCHVEIPGVYFNTGSAQILEESKPALAAVARLIKQSKFSALTIDGHTDNIGTPAYNQDLSERRAEAVRQALVANFGVPAGQLTAKGYGLTRPVESNATPEGRARNRRVELTRPCGPGK